MPSFTTKSRYQSEQPWYAPSSGVESVLFVGVQLVMVLCVVLVAVQAFAT
jgi:hypothetical protein